MKIRNRLLIAFVVMTIFPLLLTLCCANFILRKQGIPYQDRKAGNYGHFDFLMDPLSFFYQMTLDEYHKIEAAIEENPDQFLDTAYSAKIDTNLLEKDSSLIVLREGRSIYKNAHVAEADTLPIRQNWQEGDFDQMTYLDSSGKCIVKEKNFRFRDRTGGTILLITDFTKIRSRWIHALQDIFVALFIIYLGTNALLTAWIYQGIVRPLNILRLATTQIGNGILNHPIQVTGKDEIGQLCTDFDNMRIRLKNIINRQLHTENDILELLDSLSHDLKTPITAIKGYTEGIMDGVADTKEKQLRYLKTIYTKSNDISYLIDELSVYAKIEQDVFPYDFIPINLDEYFNDCIDSFRLDLEQDHISIDYYNSTDPATKVLIDPQQLRRAIQNLVGNAVKYNDNPDGHIYVRIEDMPEKTNKPQFLQINENGTQMRPERISKSFVRVEIEDNGPGIAAADLPHIFERFYRADDSRNSSKRGSGLGLAIVKMIIYDHGGTVGAESIEGTGSLFHFTLRKVLPEEM